MDMGFSRAHCIEALLHTMTVEQATEYLLANPATLRRPVRFNVTYSLYINSAYRIRNKKLFVCHKS